MGQELTKLSEEEMKDRKIREMDQEMKMKLGRGANYNMKIVIKGDKNTGKTCLFERLQRKAFIEDYVSTEQIQIATIPWDYKSTSDRIKCEVWDVVDKAPRKVNKSADGLKIRLDDGLSSEEEEEEEEERVERARRQTVPAASAEAAGSGGRKGGPQGAFPVRRLDAATVDVYKGAHAVIFTMDPRKKWTFEYIERELPNVPPGVFVLILVNYRDQPQSQRVLSEYEIAEFVQRQGKFVRAIECSMRNCYGMKSVRCFFNLPFLKMKRNYIMQQLKENEADLNAADQELEFVTQEQDYDFYLKWLEENKKNKNAQSVNMLPAGPPLRNPSSSSAASLSAASPAPSSSSSQEGARAIGASLLSFLTKDNSSLSPSTAQEDHATQSTSSPPPSQQQPPSVDRPAARRSSSPRSEEGRTQNTNKAEVQKTEQRDEGIKSWTSKFFGGGKSEKSATKKQEEPRDVEGDLRRLAQQAKAGKKSSVGIDDFVPQLGGDDEDFWGGDDDSDEDNKTRNQSSRQRDEEEEDDEPAFAKKVVRIAADEDVDFDEIENEVVEVASLEALPRPSHSPSPSSSNSRSIKKESKSSSGEEEENNERGKKGGKSPSPRSPEPLPNNKIIEWDDEDEDETNKEDEDWGHIKEEDDDEEEEDQPRGRRMMLMADEDLPSDEEQESKAKAKAPLTFETTKKSPPITTMTNSTNESHQQHEKKKKTQRPLIMTHFEDIDDGDEDEHAKSAAYDDIGGDTNGEQTEKSERRKRRESSRGEEERRHRRHKHSSRRRGDRTPSPDGGKGGEEKKHRREHKKRSSHRHKSGSSSSSKDRSFDGGIKF